MTEEQKDNNESEQARDDKGRFAPQTQTDKNGQTQPRESDYTKMNSLLAKQLGLSDKIADFQMKFTPRQLFEKLEFMMDNSAITEKPQQQGKLRPNEQIVPISPKQSPLDNMPGEIIGKPNMKDENFSIQIKMDPRELLSKKE